jgi:TatD DNase family protein
VNLVDSHCHLDHEKFQGDLEETLARARAAGVLRFLAIGTGEGPPDLETGVRMAELFEGFVATAGVHPHDASKADAGTFPRLAALAKHPKVMAIGEIGLDYHYDFSPRAVQMSVFVQQLEIAREAGLPVVIHTREAWADTLRVLRERWQGGGIMHCFTGGVAQAREALDLGFHLAFGGVVTFPKSEETRAAAAMVPDELLLVETDAPYLAPAPHRGKRNEPAFLPATVRKLADIRGVDPEYIAEITTRNFERLCLAKANGYTDNSDEQR